MRHKGKSNADRGTGMKNRSRNRGPSADEITLNLAKLVFARSPGSKLQIEAAV